MRPTAVIMSFWQKSRALVITFGSLLALAALLDIAMAFVFNPITTETLQIGSSGAASVRFWIITSEPYGISLRIANPGQIDRDLFQRLLGCEMHMDYSAAKPGVTIPFEWSIRSLADGRIVARSTVPSITPNGHSCSTVGGAHLLSLGGFSIAPGRYLFEFRFAGDVPQLAGLPAQVSATCCGKVASTPLASFLIFCWFFVVPILVLLLALLALLLLAGFAVHLRAARRAN
jgi:hypothetical protein